MTELGSSSLNRVGFDEGDTVDAAKTENEWLAIFHKLVRNSDFLQAMVAFSFPEQLKGEDQYVRQFTVASRADLSASRALHAIKDFPNSVFHLQQSTEKLTKAYAIHFRFVNVEEARETGHYSLAIFFKLLKRRWAEPMFRLAKSTTPNLDLGPLRKLDSIVEEYDKASKKAELARMPKEGILESLKIEARFGDITNLVRNKLQTLPPEMRRALQQAATEFARDRGLQIEPAKISKIIEDFGLDISEYEMQGRFWRLYVLCIITYPHSTFTRYPSRFFNPAEYKPGLGIVDAIGSVWTVLESHLDALEQALRE